MKHLYFAYGSNMHPRRLQERIRDAAFICTSALRGYKLTFNKRGQDNSSKCNIAISKNHADVVYGVIYQIDNTGLQTLNQIEGRGYILHECMMDVKSRERKVLTYTAMPAYIDEADKPFEWYKDMVVTGMRYFKFSPGYIVEVEKIPSRQDPDAIRQQEMWHILDQMKKDERGNQ